MILSVPSLHFVILISKTGRVVFSSCSTVNEILGYCITTLSFLTMQKTSSLRTQNFIPYPKVAITLVSKSSIYRFATTTETGDAKFSDSKFLFVEVTSIFEYVDLWHNAYLHVVVTFVRVCHLLIVCHV